MEAEPTAGRTLRLRRAVEMMTGDRPQQQSVLELSVNLIFHGLLIKGEKLKSTFDRSPSDSALIE